MDLGLNYNLIWLHHLLWKQGKCIISQSFSFPICTLAATVSVLSKGCFEDLIHVIRSHAISLFHDDRSLPPTLCVQLFESLG